MNQRADDFHKLERRLCLSGVLLTRTGLRIGSGGGGELDAVDLPVLRDAHGYPLIPGSSIKGVMRSTIEALVRGAGHDLQTGLWACDPQSEGKGDESKACGFHASGQRDQVKTDDHCAVCRLLGSRVVASHARFSDALVAPDDRRGRIPVEVRDGVAIDRDLRVAYGAQKYDFEVVSPGTRFALEVFVDNYQDWLMGLLVIGFEQIAEGFSALGGFTSRGLGRVEIQWSGMTQVTARELLDGQLPARMDQAAITAAFEEWRKALAKRARGGG